MDIPYTVIVDLSRYMADHKKCDDKCKQRIYNFLKTQPPQTMTVYRGQHFVDELDKSISQTPEIIKIDGYPWFSTTLDKLVAHHYTNLSKPMGTTKDYLCCLFTIHIVNVPTLALKHVNSPLRGDTEKEVIVLGGGTFYQDKECTIPGFKKTIEGSFECWYTLPSKGGRRTRRKKLRKTRRKHKQ